MKSRFYLFLVVIIGLVVIVALVKESASSIETPYISSRTTKATVERKTSSVSTAPKTTATAPKTADKYYPVHVASGVVEIHYSTSTVAKMITVSNPPLNSSISSPFTVTGLARGTWYFEGVSGMILTDIKGKIIVSSNVRAQGNWMTNDFVPFMGTLTYPPQQAGSYGVLVLKNDNPSGIPANDRAVEILVRFK